MKLAFWLGIPGLLVWIAPGIVGQLGFHQSLIQSAVGPFDGQIQTGSASLGWLSPVRLRDVVLLDGAGQEVAHIPRIESERSLLGLAFHSSSPGLFRLIEPHLTVKLRPDGSNLEDLLNSFPPKPASSSARPSVALEVVDGRVVLVDQAAGTAWNFDGVLARVDVPANPIAPIELKIDTHVGLESRPADFVAALPTRRSADGEGTGALHDPDAASGSLTAELLWRPGTQPMGNGQLQLHSDTFPLEVAGPVLRRFVEPQMNVAGTLSIKGSYAWSSGDEADREPTGVVHQATLDALDVQRLDVASPKFLRRDRLRIPQLTGHGRVKLAGQLLETQDLEFDAGFARIAANGETALDELQAVAAARPSAEGSGQYQLRGELDLAQLAQLLPDTLRVREGTEITSGKLSATLTSQPERDGRRWEGKIESTNLTATNFGKRVTWEQPIQVTLAAQQTSTGLVVERLDCVSSFFHAEARGTLDDGQVELRGDLERLAEELDRFIDLGSSQLSGRLRGGLSWRRQADEQIEAKGQLRLEQLQFAFGNVRPWQEELLDVNFGAKASTRGAALDRIESADLKVTAGRDALTVALTEPVSKLSTENPWPIQGRLVGHLENWLPRVQLWLPLPGWTLAGAADVAFAGRVAAAGVECETGKVSVTDLQARGPGWNIVEPQAKLEFAGDWSRELGRVRSPALTFTSSALAFRAENVSIATGEQGAQLAATVGFRSDLARLSSWTHEPGQPVSWYIGGLAQGQFDLAHAAESTTAKWNAEITKVSYAVPVQAVAQPPAGPGRIVPAAATGATLKTLWSEPKLTIAGQGKYMGPSGTLEIERCDLAADDLQILLRGKLAELTGACVAEVEGELGYDLASLSQHFRQQLGDGVEIQGRDSQPFTLRGPLRNPVVTTGDSDPALDPRFASASSKSMTAAWPPADLTGEAGVRWESIRVYGLPIGAGDIQGRLAQGAIDFKPLDVPVSEGRLKLAPRLAFEPQGPTLHAEPGVALEDVRISPEMCAYWLKFVLPIAAEATQVDGRLSAQFSDPVSVPLAEPLDGRARGSIEIRSAQIGPGPLSRELINLAQIIQSVVRKQPLPAEGSTAGAKQWVELPAQEIPFHWEQRRVHHQGLQMAVRDVVLITSGSVGLDQTLDLMAEVPVRDEWIAQNRYLQSLKGQKIQVPITGTLTAPRLDRRALQQITSQTVSGAARGLLEQEVNRGLDKLLKPRGDGTPAAPGTAPGTPGATPGGSNSPFPFQLPQFNPRAPQTPAVPNLPPPPPNQP